MTTIQSLTDKALDGFWEVIVAHFPHATSGDLSPLTTVKLSIVAEEAVAEWIAYNATTRVTDIAVGYRFSLFRQVDRFPDFAAACGLTGTVTTVNDRGVWARMDQPVAGAEHWDNQIHWQTTDEFAADTIPVCHAAATPEPEIDYS
jgi:hypothetical protein